MRIFDVIFVDRADKNVLRGYRTSYHIRLFVLLVESLRGKAFVCRRLPDTWDLLWVFRPRKGSLGGWAFK